MKRAIFYLCLIGILTSCSKKRLSEVQIGPFDGIYLVEYQEWNARTAPALPSDTNYYEVSFELIIENDKFSIDLNLDETPIPSSSNISLDGICEGELTWTTDEMTFGGYDDCDCFCFCSPFVDCAGNVIFGTYNYIEEPDQLLLQYENIFTYEWPEYEVEHYQRVEVKLTLQE